MNDADRETFAFTLLNVFTKRPYRARWKTTRAEIEKLGGTVIEGTGETRSDPGGGGWSHLATAPPKSED